MIRIFRHWCSGRKAAFFLAEASALLAALLAVSALVAAPAAATPGQALASAVARGGVAALAFAGALYFGDLYDLRAAWRDRAEGRALARALGLALLALATAELLLPAVLPVEWLSARSLLPAAGTGIAAVLLARTALPALVGGPVRVVVLGEGARARELARCVRDEAEGVVEVVGFADANGPSAPAAPASGVDEVARRLRARIVVVAMEEQRAGLPMDALLACRTHGVRVMTDVAFAEAVLQRIPLALVRPSALVFDEGFRAGRRTRAVKRALDVVLAVALVAALSPVLLAAALAIALTDGAPVLYSQERTGRGGRRYRIWKLRTMRRDAEENGATWALVRDDRVLPFGRVLRRTRIDELPQLWNVLRGEMSFVGPRPERPVFLEELKRRWPLFALREEVKPGLTGWAQLKYGYGSTLEEQARKLEYDLYYVKNESLFLDLVCLFHTARVVLTGRGAR